MVDKKEERKFDKKWALYHLNAAITEIGWSTPPNLKLVLDHLSKTLNEVEKYA